MREPHMSERTSEFDRTEFDRTSELDAAPSPTEALEAPSPGWGAPAWGAPQHEAPQHEAPQQAPYDVEAPAAVVGSPAFEGHPGEVGFGEPGPWPGAEPLQTADDDEPFVPAKRYRMARFTKVLVCVCLVLAGALGGAAIQKAVDLRNGAGTTGRNFSQFTPGAGTGNGTGQNGAGTGTGGFSGRNRASQGATAPTAPASVPSAGSAGN